MSIASVGTNVPPIAGPSFAVDLVATAWAGVRTYNEYQRGEITKRQAVTLEATGLLGVFPGPEGTALSFINIMETFSAGIR